ncbi:hypothetical protein ACTFIZ_002609 [Dictyostelium cf. discoideum]
MMNFKHIISIIIFILYINLIDGAKELTPFIYGDRISMECKDNEGNWKLGPICLNQKQELSVYYGRDSPLYCGIYIDEKEFNRIKDVLNRNSSWECRIPISSESNTDDNIYIPLSIQLWGYPQDDHLDITTHYNFIFHVEKGIIIGATLYPVKDKFQDVRKNAVFTIHGAIKWFNGGSHVELNDSLKLIKDNTNDFLNNLDYWIVILWIVLSMFTSLILFSLIYKYKLKPNLIRKYLKND